MRGAGFHIGGRRGGHLASNGLGALDELGIVQRVERLERSVASGALEHAVFAAGCVEIHHHRMRHRAAPERVEAPAVFVLSRRGLPRLAVIDDLPNAVGLRRHHARAADLVAEQAGDGQRLVAHHLGLQSHARAAGQQSVVRVTLRKRGRDL